MGEVGSHIITDEWFYVAWDTCFEHWRNSIGDTDEGWWYWQMYNQMNILILGSGITGNPINKNFHIFAGAKS